MACPPQVWNGVLRRLAEELPPLAVEAWLRPIRVEANGRGLRLLCPSPFHRARVQTHYLSRIRELVAAELGRPMAVELAVGESVSEPQPSSADAEPASTLCASAARQARSSHRLRSERRAKGSARVRACGSRDPGSADPLGSARQIALEQRFDTFVVGPCNALAREACKAMAERRSRSLSTLYLAAGSGLGKTHLARSVVAAARVPAGKRVLYFSAEQFTAAVVGALRERRMPELKRRLREECDLLVVEDVQYLRGRDATQLELFHTLEHLQEHGARVVLTGDRWPRELAGLEGGLIERISRGFVAEIEPPSREVRERILRAKAAAAGVRLPEECLERLSEGVTGSVRELESALFQVVVTASLLKRPIDLELTERVLHKIEPRAGRPRLDLDTVIRVVAAHFRTTPAALAARSRRRDVLWARQVAIYLCRRYTDASLEEIGRAFGRRHSSVAHAIARTEQTLFERVRARYQVEEICSRLDRLASGPSS